MEKKGLEKLDIYQLAIQLGQDVWNLVNSWDVFPLETMGQAYIQSTDSIATNIAAGYGRQSPNQKRNYMVFARSAALVAKTWLKKAQQRNLIDESAYQGLHDNTEMLISKLYGFVRFLEEEGGATPVQSLQRRKKLTSEEE